MKTRSSLIFWILIVVFAAHGALPGVVVCSEAAGQVAVENIENACCYGDSSPVNQATDFVFTSLPGSGPGGSCGPCTDAPLSLIPVTKTARNGDGCIDALPVATLAFDSAAIVTKTCSGSEFVATNAALISIKTTTLLI